jgi:ABC-type glycerol-3-phosphate transport system permease component
MRSGTAAAIDVSQALTPRTIQMTISMIVVFPILCAYPFLQRYFVKGIVLGAVKG